MRADNGIKKQRVAGTETFRVIRYKDVPAHRRKEVTYTKVVCEVRPQKDDPNRTQITIGHNRIIYPGNVATPISSLKLTKIIINSVLFRHRVKFACFDVKKLACKNPMDRSEYVKIKITDIPAEFVDKYNLHSVTHNGWLYFETVRG